MSAGQGAGTRRRVLHVVPALAPRYGGPSRVAVEMTRALQDRGLETLLLATDADGPGRLPVVTARPVEHQGTPALFFPRQWSEAVKYSAPLARWLTSHVHSFDLVHVHAVFSHASVAAGRAARRSGVPYVVRPLGTLDPWSLGQKAGRKRVAWWLGARALVRGAAAVHYTTEGEQERAERALGLARGVVVPLGVEESLLKDGGDRGAFGRRQPAVGRAPYVLALGRLHPKKGLEALIPAFLEATWTPDLAGWRLVLAGDGDPSYVASLRRRAADVEGGERVIFAGWLEGEPRQEAIRGAALLAQPSRQENFALAVVEAMAAGVPALVSPEVNLSSAVQAAGAGWVSRPGPAELAGALRLVMRNEAERAVRGAAARDLVRRHYTWPAVAEALAGLYERLLAGRTEAA